MITIESFNGRCSKCGELDEFKYHDYQMGFYEFCRRCQDHRCRPAGFTDWARLKSHMVPKWRASFDVFKAAVGFKPSPAHVLTRANSKKPYGPDNPSRWVLRSEIKRKPRARKQLDYTPYFNEKKQKWMSGGKVFSHKEVAEAYALAMTKDDF